ncbi:MAG TPA: hypothetical protein ENH94_00300 [Phycisphaerales bacterium]|nr:hypothetical protein [Phycisphaerales bacterium]
MAEETGVTEVDPAAVDQTTESQEETVEQTEQVSQDLGSKETIPKERLDQVIGQREELKLQNDLLQQQLAIYQANPAAPAGQQRQATSKTNEGPDYLGSNVPAEEFLSKDQVNAAFGQMYQQFTQAIANQQFQISNPDFKDIVGTQQKMAPALTQYLIDNPATAAQISTHPQPMHYLYTLGKAAAAAEKAKAKAEKKPEPSIASPSAIGGGRGGLVPAEKYGKMTKDEFEVSVAKAKAGG